MAKTIGIEAVFESFNFTPNVSRVAEFIKSFAKFLEFFLFDFPNTNSSKCVAFGIFNEVKPRSGDFKLTKRVFSCFD